MLGRSVRGRPITRLAHGRPAEEGARARPWCSSPPCTATRARPRQILRSLRGGQAIHGVDLWLVPVYNPDGLAAHNRRNAHGVDLNRNYPYHWADLDGNYESGPHPARSRRPGR